MLASSGRAGEVVDEECGGLADESQGCLFDYFWKFSPLLWLLVLICMWYVWCFGIISSFWAILVCLLCLCLDA